MMTLVTEILVILSKTNETNFLRILLEKLQNMGLINKEA